MLNLGSEVETTDFADFTDQRRRHRVAAIDFFVPMTSCRGYCTLRSVICEICAICGLSLIFGFYS
jgi:hypothetical protein